MSTTDDRIAVETAGVDAELVGLVSRYEATQDPASRDLILSSICQHLGLHQPPPLIHFLDPPSSDDDTVLEFDDSDIEMDDVDEEEDVEEEEEEEVTRLATFDWERGLSRPVVVLTAEELRERQLKLEAAIEESLTEVEDNINGQGLECCVCLEDICTDGEVPLKRTHCRHSFHADCIRHWLKVGGASCPVCRFQILPAQQPDA